MVAFVFFLLACFAVRVKLFGLPFAHGTTCCGYRIYHILLLETLCYSQASLSARSTTIFIYNLILEVVRQVVLVLRSDQIYTSWMIVRAPFPLKELPFSYLDV